MNDRRLTAMAARRGSVRALDVTDRRALPEGAAMVTRIDRDEVQRMLGERVQLVDVLLAQEYEAEHIPRAINIPLRTLRRETARQLHSDRPVIVYCHDYQ